MEISLIPKKEKEKGLPRFVTFQGPKLEFTLISKIGTLLLIVGVLASAGFYVWQIQLKKQLRLASEELKSTIGQRDLSLEGRLKNLNVVLEVFKGVLDSHRHWSGIFKMLEERTLPSVKFSFFDADDASATIRLNGHSTSYNTLAQQVKIFEDTSNINTVTVSGIKATERGRVDFSLDINFSRELIIRK